MSRTLSLPVAAIPDNNNEEEDCTTTKMMMPIANDDDNQGNTNDDGCSRDETPSYCPCSPSYSPRSPPPLSPPPLRLAHSAPSSVGANSSNKRNLSSFIGDEEDDAEKHPSSFQALKRAGVGKTYRCLSARTPSTIDETETDDDHDAE